jgi:hypothetical protein
MNLLRNVVYWICGIDGLRGIGCRSTRSGCQLMVIVALQVSFVDAAPLVEATTVPFPDTALSAAERRASCGVNSLYLYLCMHGSRIDYERLTRMLGDTDRGQTLVALKYAAHRCGQESSVYHCKISDHLRQLPLPFIVHMPNGPLTGTGHYIVVIKYVDDSSVEMADGTTGKIQAVSTDWLMQKSSGYCLARSNAASHHSMFVAVNMAILTVLGSSTLFLFLRSIPDWQMKVTANGSDVSNTHQQYELSSSTWQ